MGGTLAGCQSCGGLDRQSLSRRLGSCVYSSAGNLGSECLTVSVTGTDRRGSLRSSLIGVILSFSRSSMVHEGTTDTVYHFKSTCTGRGLGDLTLMSSKSSPGSRVGNCTLETICPSRVSMCRLFSTVALPETGFFNKACRRFVSGRVMSRFRSTSLLITLR